MVQQNPKQWALWLPLAEFWYNTNYHTSLKATPFEALYGFSPPTHSLNSYLPNSHTDAVEVMGQRQQKLQELRENLTHAQHRMKLYADRHRSEREFQEGEFVYLKLQPYRQNSMTLRRNIKLSARYYGPFKILSKVGKVAYHLDLPESYRIHPVFHVSLLKKTISPTAVPSSDLPQIDQDGNFMVQPATFLDQRLIYRHGQAVRQLLVQWSEFDDTFVSWEDEKFLKKKFPKLDPWGQGSLVGGSIVMNEGSIAEIVEDGSEVPKKGRGTLTEEEEMLIKEDRGSNVGSIE